MKTKEEWVASMNGLLYEIYTLSRDLSKLADSLERPDEKEVFKRVMKQATEDLKNLQNC